MKKSGIILKEFRKNNSMTVAKFAELLGVSQVFLTHLEHDKRKISENLFKRLKEFLSDEEIMNLRESEKLKNIPDDFTEKLKKLEIENKNLKLILKEKSKEKIDLKFADYLRDLIKEKNKKLIKIHSETKISASYLTDILKGRNLPSKEKLEILIKNLNLNNQEIKKLKLYWLENKNPFEDIAFSDSHLNKEKISSDIIEFFSDNNISIEEKEIFFYLIQNLFFKEKYSRKNW